MNRRNLFSRHEQPRRRNAYWMTWLIWAFLTLMFVSDLLWLPGATVRLLGDGSAVFSGTLSPIRWLWTLASYVVSCTLMCLAYMWGPRDAYRTLTGAWTASRERVNR